MRALAFLRGELVKAHWEAAQFPIEMRNDVRKFEGDAENARRQLAEDRARFEARALDERIAPEDREAVEARHQNERKALDRRAVDIDATELDLILTLEGAMARVRLREYSEGPRKARLVDLLVKIASKHPDWKDWLAAHPGILDFEIKVEPLHGDRTPREAPTASETEDGPDTQGVGGAAKATAAPVFGASLGTRPGPGFGQDQRTPLPPELGGFGLGLGCGQVLETGQSQSRSSVPCEARGTARTGRQLTVCELAPELQTGIDARLCPPRGPGGAGSSTGRCAILPTGLGELGGGPGGVGRVVAMDTCQLGPVITQSRAAPIQSASTPSLAAAAAPAPLPAPPAATGADVSLPDLGGLVAGPDPSGPGSNDSDFAAEAQDIQRPEELEPPASTQDSEDASAQATQLEQDKLEQDKIVAEQEALVAAAMAEHISAVEAAQRGEEEGDLPPPPAPSVPDAAALPPREAVPHDETDESGEDFEDETGDDLATTYGTEENIEVTESPEWSDHDDSAEVDAGTIVEVSGSADLPSSQDAAPDPSTEPGPVPCVVWESGVSEGDCGDGAPVPAPPAPDPSAPTQAPAKAPSDEELAAYL